MDSKVLIKNAAEKLLKNNNQLKIKLYGQSMIPTINPGDEVILISKFSYAENDIVAYTDKDRSYFVVHRILKYDNFENKFYIKGDNSEKGSWIDKDKIYAKVFKVNGEFV